MASKRPCSADDGCSGASICSTEGRCVDPDSPGAPIIEHVNGNGTSLTQAEKGALQKLHKGKPATNHFADALVVRGKNLSNARASLVSSKNTVDLSVVPTGDSLVAALPSNLQASSYKLQVTNANGRALTQLLILQGEKGAKGDTGATGQKGVKGDKGDTGTTLHKMLTDTTAADHHTPFTSAEAKTAALGVCLPNSSSAKLVVAGDASLTIHSNTNSPTTGHKMLALKSGVTSPSDVFSVDNQGKVGIGTGSPGSSLDVKGSSRFGLENTVSRTTVNGADEKLMPFTVIFPVKKTYRSAMVFVNMTGTDGVQGGLAYSAILHVAMRDGPKVYVLVSNSNSGINSLKIAWSFNGTFLMFKPTWSGGGSSLSTSWNYTILTGATSS